MNLLLDTHVLLWWLRNDPMLKDETREVIEASDNMVVVSAVTVWEMVIKQALGKLEVPARFYEGLQDEPFATMPMTAEHAVAVRTLPLHHRDPFDRMLVAQAQVEGLTLITRDRHIQQYDVSCLIA